MAADPVKHTVNLERLSALVDGELDDSATASACAVWREDAALRASWHEYHLIGDLLRSDDLASTPQRDAAFLDALRLRLADEPVVLAPQPLPVSGSAGMPAVARVASMNRGGWSWRASSAVAAGFVAVAGVVMVRRGPGVPSEPAPAIDTGIAQASPTLPVAQPLVANLVSTSEAPEPPVTVASRKLIRDARLDRYLSAHQQFAGSSALSVPSAYLRNATADAASR